MTAWREDSDAVTEIAVVGAKNGFAKRRRFVDLLPNFRMCLSALPRSLRHSTLPT